MPKKERLPEPEIHAMILKDVNIRLGCSDFAPEFTLEDGEWRANWALWQITNVGEWEPDCAQAFAEAVERYRRKFDIAWPSLWRPNAALVVSPFLCEPPCPGCLTSA